MDFIIEDVKARQVLDSRGNPTIEVEVISGKARGVAMAPSGASKGREEAVELRDGGREFHGKGVMKAVNNVRKIIAPAIIGMDVREQEEIDRKMIEMDATPNKNVLGANACIATSIACCKCAAAASEKEVYEYLNGKANLIPIPFMNVINGGVHAGNELYIQEHLIAPVGAGNFAEAVRMGSEIYHTLRKKIEDKFGKTAINVGDEGGFAPPISDSYALDLIMEAIEENGYEEEVKLAIDAAATSFYREGYYVMEKKRSSGEMVDYYMEMAEKYPLISIEDGFHEEDWDAFAELTAKIGDNVQIIGDDIFVTNPKRLRRGIKGGVCNALLLKPNQIGTLSEAMEVAKICHENGYSIMVSHRSGDTCDDFIADLAVAINAGQIKSGAPCRGERVAKYNRLMKIEEMMEKPEYAGKKWNKWGL